MSAPTVTALIAEDEPLLAMALQAELKRAWPELQIAATVGDGASAVTQALALKPDVLFFDIRMPGMSGIEAAAELAEEWPEDARFPALVFVTAYDQYAVQAFETQAVDYLLKPVQTARLQKTVAKLRELLAQRATGPATLDATLAQLRQLLQGGVASGGGGNGAAPASVGLGATHAEGQVSNTAPGSSAAPLTVVQASVGAAIHMVPISEVVYFEAADKYVRVLTATREFLIRTALRELLPQLDTQVFWQIHRGTVVRATAIASVTRDEAGKLHLALRERPERLVVSRLHAHLFRAM